jgi:hypothetical protein
MLAPPAACSWTKAPAACYRVKEHEKHLMGLVHDLHDRASK